MKQRHMSATQKRYFIFYLLFACVLLATYIPIYQYVHGVTYENVREQSTRALEKGMVSMEASANMIINAYTATEKDTRFVPLKYVNGDKEYSPSELAALVNMMRYSLIPADLVYDAAILRTPSLIIAKNRSFYSDTYYTFYPDFLQVDSYSFDEWLALLQSGGLSGAWLPEMTYRSPEYPSGYKALTYVRVWRSSVVGTPILFFATVNSDLLVSRLAEAEVLQRGYAKISDQDGNLLLSRGDTEMKNCEVISSVSTVTGFRLEVGVPKDYLNQQMVPLERMIILYIILFVVIALILVLVFSHRSAAPMKLLLTSIQSSPGEMPQEGSSGLMGKKLYEDYARLASGISQLNGQLKSNAELIEEQREKLRDALFDQALTNSLYSERDQQSFQRFFHDFPASFYLAMIKQTKTHQASFAFPDDALQARTRIMQEALNQIPSLYYAHYIFRGPLLLVLAQEEKEALEKLREKLAAEQIDIHVTLTQCFHDVADLPLAYDQIQRMELMPAQSGVFTYDDFNSVGLSHVSMPLSYHALQKMYDALSTGKESLARIILNDCANSLLLHPDQLMTARHTHSQISHMLAQLKMEYPAALFSVVIPSFESNNLEQLFRQELPECFHRVSVSLLENQTPQDDLSSQVLEFINENLFSNEMCVTFVADHFNIAKATLQKIIKDSTGATLSVYINTLRLERAYRLLKEPGVSVQQVSEMCGFSSTNSFYKAFRRKYGFAPSAISGGDEGVVLDDGEEEEEAEDEE